MKKKCKCTCHIEKPPFLIAKCGVCGCKYKDRSMDLVEETINNFGSPFKKCFPKDKSGGWKKRFDNNIYIPHGVIDGDFCEKGI